MKRLTGSKGTLIAFGLVALAILVAWLLFKSLLFLVIYALPAVVVIGIIVWLVVRKRER
jgi:membrane protein implicated in regulation of membrane protease activity